MLWEISGGAFACEARNVCLHKSCVVQKRRPLSHEIMHPLHLQHQLHLGWTDWDFICNKCLYPSPGYGYGCPSCDFSLDLACASLENDQLPKDQESLRFKDGRRKTIKHYSHGCKMSIFNYENIHAVYFVCEKHLSEVSFGCVRCKFYLHQVCSDKIPRTISHPFHPGHPLRLSYTGGNCYVCKNDVRAPSACYTCEMSSFQLDFHCAKLLPLKLDCHPHLLAYFRDYTSKFHCRTCGKDCGGASICCCVQCDISFHLKSVVPSGAKQRYHRHPLILMESIKEGDSGEYCCDVCENERGPKHLAYYRQSCTFVAHVQCVFDEDQISSATILVCNYFGSRMKGLMPSTI